MSEALITLTPDAVNNITRLLSDSDMEGQSLRFGVRGGGCSGYSYLLEFSDVPEEGDITQEINGVKVFIAELKRDFIAGCTIDFVDELLETGFKIKNPNVKRSCGCGESFDIDE